MKWLPSIKLSDFWPFADKDTVLSFAPPEDIEKTYIETFKRAEDTEDAKHADLVLGRFVGSFGKESKIGGFPYTLIFANYFMQRALNTAGEIKATPDENYKVLVKAFEKARKVEMKSYYDAPLQDYLENFCDAFIQPDLIESSPKGKPAVSLPDAKILENDI